MIEVEEFERVYRTSRDLVFRHALRVAGRRDVAEEITGDAFVALFEHRADVTPAMLPGWLVTFVKRRGIDHWRHREVVQRHEATASEAVTIPAESTAVLVIQDVAAITERRGAGRMGWFLTENRIHFSVN